MTPSIIVLIVEHNCIESKLSIDKIQIEKHINTGYIINTHK